MININMNSLLESGISRYALVIGVAKRAAEITTEVQKNKASKTGDYDKPDYGTEKSVTLAVNEYLAKKFDIIDPGKNKVNETETEEIPVFFEGDSPEKV